jgi:hypothetical protein
MKKLLMISLMIGFAISADARGASMRISAGHHKHRHHHAYLTKREEQKPIHKLKR